VDPLPADSRAIVARVFAGDGGFADFQTGWKSAWESSSDWVQELVAGVEELRDVRRSARRATIAKWGRLHKATHFGGPKLSKRGRDVIDTYLYLTDTASRVASFDRAYTRQTAADMVLQAWKDATQMTWDEVRNAVEPDDAVISPYGCPEDELLQVTFGVGSDEPREMARRAITTAKCRQQSMDDDSIGLGQSMR
jgi:hypothetical protein